MWKNYFRTGFRNLLKNRVFSFINTLGLSLGIGSCLLIAAYVNHELSYDQYHVNANRIYRIVNDVKTPKDNLHWAITSGPLAPSLKADFPEIMEAARLYPGNVVFNFEGKQFFEERLFYADSTIFEIFTFPFLQGSANTALVDPYSVVLTQSAAKKYFGDSDPLGKILVSNGESYKVTGVTADVPTNSHFTFDVLISMSTGKNIKPLDRYLDVWFNLNFYTYILLPDQYNPESLKEKLPAFFKKYNGEDQLYSTITFDFELEPLTKIYFYSDFERPIGDKGSINSVYIFTVIAIFIIVIACVNFMNLSTARSLERAKEVAMRKVVGSMRHQLIVQFLSESLILCFLSMILGVLLFFLFLPFFNDVSGKTISIDLSAGLFSISFLLLFAFVLGIISGMYPAFVLSDFSASSVLKGAFKNSKRGIVLRAALVVVQFAISFVLIVGTLTVFYQTKFMLSQDLGFTKENILLIDYSSDNDVNKQIKVIKNELSQVPSVVDISASSRVPGKGDLSNFISIENKEGEMTELLSDFYYVDENFFKNFEIDVLKGTSFNVENDSINELIINEAALRELHYPSLDDALGKRFMQGRDNGKIVGVIRDFHFRSLQDAVRPLVIRYDPSYMRFLSMKVSSSNLGQTINELEQKWRLLVPHRPFNVSLLEDTYNKQYAKEERLEKILAIFSILALFVGCMGLFGLVSYSVSQRAKEISVRKAFGASSSNVVTLFLKEHTRFLIASFLIAAPIAYYFTSNWLAAFPYRIEMSIIPFLIACFVILISVCLIVLLQSVKVVISNTARTLKCE